MAIRKFIAKNKCTFRAREKGAARYYAIGDPMTVTDGKVDVPEKLFTEVKAPPVKEAVEAADGDVEKLRQKLVDMGIDFDPEAKVAELTEILEAAESAIDPEKPEGDDPDDGMLD